ncbi:MAG: GNAT family N-acetyltransferase [Bacteroidetes bacterium]|nr:MAG: GNAT family N-acetyltransferase [Bacteroidota bacterium]
MIELKKKDYSKVIDTLKKVQINNLFARAVVENHISGKVYVDNTVSPTTFYVVHPYGMSLLLGKHDNENFNKAFKDHALNKNNTRNTHEWMQAFPNSWHEELETLFSDCSIKSSENKNKLTTNIVELNTRVNFQFNQKKYSALKKEIRVSKSHTIRTTEKEFKSMEGAVIPLYFWDNANDFLTNGIGFSTYSDEELACTAFASCLMDNFLELGMETIPKFRGKGFARYTCSILIDYCLENGYEPVWACSLENTGSYQLAKKLGFDVALQIPYYRLSK